jgi:hypothetical protein
VVLPPGSIEPIEESHAQRDEDYSRSALLPPDNEGAGLSTSPPVQILVGLPVLSGPSLRSCAHGKPFQAGPRNLGAPHRLLQQRRNRETGRRLGEPHGVMPGRLFCTSGDGFSEGPPMNYFHERQPDHDVRVQRRQLPNSQSSKIAEDEAVWTMCFNLVLTRWSILLTFRELICNSVRSLDPRGRMGSRRIRDCE